MNQIAVFVKKNRKKLGMTQKDFAMRSGLGLRFVRELEQGKATLRMDKVNQALAMFGMEAAPARMVKTVEDDPDEPEDYKDVRTTPKMKQKYIFL